MPSESWFVDETKVRSLRFAVVAADAKNVARCRAAMAALPRRGQTALHFKKESDAARRAAYKVISDLPVATTIIQVPAGVRAIPARERAIIALTRLAKERQPQRIVLELDTATVEADRRWLHRELGARDHRETQFEHLGKHHDPMLWIADGFAWAIQRGGQWIDLVKDQIVATVQA